MTATTSDAPTTTELELSQSLAERLREGPLQALVALYFKAMALANEMETDHDDRLRQLADLVHLTDTATTRFQEFAMELNAIVDELTAQQRKP